MKKIKICPICGGENLKGYNTEITKFILERINKTPTGTLLLRCKNCGFAFYEYRMSDEENLRLYDGYRNSEYQQMRQKYELNYTPELNDLIGDDKEEVLRHKEIINVKLKRYGKFHNILDYGGDKGQLIPTFDKCKKFVYDISGVVTLDGIIGYSNYNDLFKEKFDLIMCICVLEHINNVTEFINSMHRVGNDKTYFYISVPNDTPFGSTLWSWIYFFMYKIYFYRRKDIVFYPMHEHINYFTKKSIKRALNNVGLEIDEVFSYKVKTNRGLLKFIAVIGHNSN